MPFRIIILFFIIPVSLYGQESGDRGILSLASNFLACLKQKNSMQLKKMISTNISLRRMEKNKIMELTDNLVMEKINAYEYILKITGHNISSFLQQSSLLRFSAACGVENEQISNDARLNGHLYYLKFFIDFEGSKELHKQQIAEIDIIIEKNDYKIFGFIY